MPRYRLVHRSAQTPVFIKRYLAIFLFTCCLFQIQARSQSKIPATLWDKTIGGPVDDYLKAVVNTPNGGYLMGGYSFQGLEGGENEPANGLYDYMIVKTGRDGIRQWSRRYGGDNYDFLSAIVNAPDGGYLLAGYTLSSAIGDKSEDSRGGYDYWIIKIDESGNKLWDKSFGGPDYDLLYSAIATPDGGYLLGGSSSSGAGGDKTAAGNGGTDYWVIKIDGDGNKQWDKTFGGSDNDNLRVLINTGEKDFLLAGYSQSGISGDKSGAGNGSYDYWVIKVDNDGNLVWDKTIGGPGLDELTALAATPDGGFLLGGDSYSRPGGDKTDGLRGFNDYWVVKIDAEGKKLWDKTYGGKFSDYFSSIIVAGDGGFVLGGYSGSGVSDEKTAANKGELDFWIIKTDENGNQQWDNTYGGTKSDILVAMLSAGDEGVLLAGQSNSNAGADKSDGSSGSYDFWLVRIGDESIKKSQSIYFQYIDDHVYGDTDLTVTANASSDLDVTLAVVSGPATITGNTVTILGAGMVTIRAGQEGNDEYGPAADVLMSFRVYKADPEIVWEPASPGDDHVLGPGQLNASAYFKGQLVEGRFNYSPGANTPLDLGSQDLTADFIPTDSANFNAVTGISRSIFVRADPSELMIKSVTPGRGSFGTIVIVTGRHFEKVHDVSINKRRMQYVLLDNTRLLTIIPAGAKTGLIGLRDRHGNEVYSRSSFKVVSYTAQHLNSPGILPFLQQPAVTGTDSQAGTEQSLLAADAITVNVYPNPFRNSIKIDFKKTTSQNTPASIYDMEGRLMWRVANLVPGQIVLFNKELKPGAYILQVGSGIELKTCKLIRIP